MNQFLILLLLLSACASLQGSSAEDIAQQRIANHDAESQRDILVLLTLIKDQGRVTDPAEKQHIPYEFIMAHRARNLKRVLRIDSTLQCHDRGDTYQCIGRRATQDIILKLVALPLPYRLRYCRFE